VHGVLKEDIGFMHGLVVKTFTPAHWKTAQEVEASAGDAKASA
jgi:acid stress-induced BolA-like protein IbaG/YrbA